MAPKTTNADYLKYLEYCLKLDNLDPALLKTLETPHPNLANNATLFELLNYSCWPQVLAHPQEYRAITDETLTLFTKFRHSTSRDAESFRSFYQFFAAGDPHLLSHLWGLELFRLLGTAHQPTHIALNTIGEDIWAGYQSWTLIELVEQLYLRISALHNMFYLRGWSAEPDLSEILIKQICHTLIRNLNKNYHELILKIGLEDYEKLIKPLSSFQVSRNLESLISDHQAATASPRQTPKYQQITIVTACFRMPSISPLGWGIFLEKPEISKRDQCTVVHGRISFYCYKFLVQKKAKEETQLTDAFVQKLTNLHKSPLYPCHTMCNITLALLEVELTETFNEYIRLLEKYPHLLKEKTYSPLLNLKTLLKSKLITCSQNQRSVETLLTNLNQLYQGLITTNNDHDQTTLHTITKIGKEFSEKIPVSFKKVKDLDLVIIGTQIILSKLYVLNSALQFVSYLLATKVQRVFFGVYADFRGRIYYKSKTSPQAYWSYRFLYHFGPIENYGVKKNLNLVPDKWLTPRTQDLLTIHKISDTNLLSLCLSIGLTFKKQAINPQDGSIELCTLIQSGLEFYLNNAANSVEDWVKLPLKTKNLIEVIYYTVAINSARGGRPLAYYIQKDTTCSMSQHAGKLLGFNPASYHLLNLNNTDKAYDTYQIFINTLRAALQPVISTKQASLQVCIERAMTRDLFKNFIMTSEYGVGYSTAKFEFIQALKTTLTDERLVEFFKTPEVFSILYSCLRGGTSDLVFYQNTKNQWIENILKDPQQVFALTDITIPTPYYKLIEKPLYYTVSATPRVRTSITTKLQYSRQFPTEVNKKKTQMAVYVNAVHALDASYLRSIVFYSGERQIPIVTIHDGFCVPFYAETALRSIANTCFLENLPDNLLRLNTNWQPNSTTILI